MAPTMALEATVAMAMATSVLFTMEDISPLDSTENLINEINIHGLYFLHGFFCPSLLVKSLGTCLAH